MGMKAFEESCPEQCPAACVLAPEERAKGDVHHPLRFPDNMMETLITDLGQ